MGSCHAGGSYSFLTDWLNKQAKNEILYPVGTIRLLFDNEQRVGKCYRVSAKSNNVPVSVITSHACLQIENIKTFKMIILTHS